MVGDAAEAMRGGYIEQPVMMMMTMMMTMMMATMMTMMMATMDQRIDC